MTTCATRYARRITHVIGVCSCKVPATQAAVMLPTPASAAMLPAAAEV